METNSAIKTNCQFTSCRICLGEEVGEPDNPIITPCKCSGSMGYIHLECLRKWIKQRVTVASNAYVTSVSWKSLSCELCKTPFPFAVYFDGKIYELLNISPPRTPYVVVESISLINNELNGIHIISFAEKTKLIVVIIILIINRGEVMM